MMNMKKCQLLLVCLAVALTGCADRQAPLAKGELLFCKLWDKPCPRQGEMGSSSFRTMTSGNISFYLGIIIVTEPDGTRHAAPPDWFSELRFK